MSFPDKPLISGADGLRNPESVEVFMESGVMRNEGRGLSAGFRAEQSEALGEIAVARRAAAALRRWTKVE
jgi:hypothetical protein